MPCQNISLLIARIPPRIMLVLMTSLALSAGALVEWEMQKTHKQLADEQTRNARKDMTPLVVANRDIQEGESISADALRVTPVENSRMPVGALSEAGGALGMQAKFPIHAGDSILFQNLQLPQKPTGFEARIKSGFRAITFPVDTASGVAGFLTPECRVDILLQSGSGSDSRAVPILSDVEVVAVGQTYQKKSGTTEAQPTSSVTVAVLPCDGQKLINAMSAGKLYCLMRNQSDHAPVAVRDVTRILTADKKTQASEPELTSAPRMDVSPSAVSLPPDPGRLPEIQTPQLQHNVDIWSGDKKDALSFPVAKQ
jgi:pilus assembly protein CpaB